MQKSCSQNFREIHMKTSVVQTLIKSCRHSRSNFTGKGPHYRCFIVNFPKIFRTAFLLNTSRQLLLCTDILKEISFRLQKEGNRQSIFFKAMINVICNFRSNLCVQLNSIVFARENHNQPLEVFCEKRCNHVPRAI